MRVLGESSEISEGFGFWLVRECVVRFTEICNKNRGLYFGGRDFCSKYGGLRYFTKI